MSRSGCWQVARALVVFVLAGGTASAAPPAFVAPVPGSSAVAGRSVIFWMVRVTPGTDPASTGLTVTADMRPFGGPARSAFVDQGLSCDNDTADNLFFGCATPPINAPLGTRQVTLTVRDDQGRSATVQVPFTVTAPPDGDLDGLPDDWETRYGFAPAVAGDATGDPDADGVTNLDEFRGGTHPRGHFVRYLSEGAANGFFDTRLFVMNAQRTPTTVLFRFLGADGHVSALATDLDATVSRRELSTLYNLVADDEFATVVESDHPVVVERSMTWAKTPASLYPLTGGYGSHAETAVAGPSATWHFAEGATHGGFDLFYLLENPDAVRAADVTIHYLLPAPHAPIARTYRVAPLTRRTVWVDAEDARLAATDVAARLDATIPIVAERAMYYSRSDRPFAAGHAGAGLTAPAATWILAEGATGFFNTYVLISNPGSAPATVTVSYLVEGHAAPLERTYTVAASSRRTIDVAGEGGPLAAASMAITVSSTQPVVVERAMWWPAAGWEEAHLVAGATHAARRWGFADGCARSSTFATPGDSCATYVLVANPSASDTTVTVSLVGGFFRVPAVTVSLPARSRRTVSAADVLATLGLGISGADGFGVLVESAGPDIVVERSIYEDHAGVRWASGTALLGTPLTP